MMQYLIDPPVTPYSTNEDIEVWIRYLKKLEQTDEVKEAIVSAEGMRQ